MPYSYTQLSQFLACPRRYQFRYVDGWKERADGAKLLFGRAFETALEAFFRREDPAQALFDAWSAVKAQPVTFSARESWDALLQHGIRLLEAFARQERIQIPRPDHAFQLQFSRRLAGGQEFVAYIDAIGQLDGVRTVIDWKTTSSCYPEQPAGLLALDPQLVCYSWITGEPQVAFVVFVRKRIPEIQYLKATITDDQRRQFGALVEQTVNQIESGAFLPRPGIRFPQNGCLACPYIGLCLQQPELVALKLIRRPGDDLGWIDELAG
jgi:hypothetical protein